MTLKNVLFTLSIFSYRIKVENQLFKEGKQAAKMIKTTQK